MRMNSVTIALCLLSALGGLLVAAAANRLRTQDHPAELRPLTEREKLIYFGRCSHLACYQRACRSDLGNCPQGIPGPGYNADCEWCQGAGSGWRLVSYPYSKITSLGERVCGQGYKGSCAEAGGTNYCVYSLNDPSGACDAWNSCDDSWCW